MSYVSPYECAYAALVDEEVELINNTARRVFRFWCKDNEGKWHFLKYIPHIYYATVKRYDDLPVVIVENTKVVSERELFGMVMDGSITNIK